ncbi:hypothetical protein MPTK1_6g05200 [Marchantia polymorpha subsp. ruderalis]|uniref:Agglutinin domain-containing protein n=2 Tax=Marchantia polymorpha TaxID=3197 RepID=A0AAF6BNQ7_MARPO|nr:hypothetical protein MARPO_0167s0003 [Marchantia polymorpha]BBN13641.1 hypothetical protein Mp_6g05200 [Marchantia polymorpha subsp. ruderalis]|eukprot:PTQ28310.1 hypothetical protein MARPO_0167s0003 [Marchantia polymorpha]
MPERRKSFVCSVAGVRCLLQRGQPELGRAPDGRLGESPGRDSRPGLRPAAGRDEIKNNKKLVGPGMDSSRAHQCDNIISNFYSIRSMVDTGRFDGKLPAYASTLRTHSGPALLASLSPRQNSSDHLDSDFANLAFDHLFTMPALYIPPKEISFRLRGYSSNCFLYSRNNPDPTFSHDNGGPHADQWWQLIPGTGKRAGYYLIKSKYTGHVIFSRNSPDPRIGHVDGDGKYDDNWFKLEAGTGKLANHFRIRNIGPTSDTVLYSRAQDEPTISNCPGNSNVYDDQYFTFIFEDMAISRVEYKLDKAKVLGSVAEVLGTMTMKNDSAVNQTVEFDFTRTETNSSSFDYTVGFTITVGTSGKIGIPLLTEGQIKVDVSNSHTLKWGTTTTESKTYSIRFPAVAPPRHTITGTGTVTRSNIEVPFTVYSKSVATGFEVATHGIYRGITYWNVQSKIKQGPL